MSSIEIDVSEVRQFAADVSKLPDELQRHAKSVVAKGALNIKQSMAADMGKSRHFKAARHITYDLDPDGFGAEIGPEKVGAGNLANIAYFGGVRGGGGTVRDPREALAEEVPRFEQALSDLIEELWP